MLEPFDLLSYGARRLTVATEGRVDLSAFVEDPQHVEIFELQPTDFPHQTFVVRDQPYRRPRSQLVEMIGNVEHALIKPRGCDS